ncbi:toll/interleukin-1 receptor domain-containing protein [Oscillatoria sp. FACHB-1407]|uniref:toll/interleukin-1 receptor domain-containing protein n=1 Tax=Oscillatoria sp. FACHB-1407 TaxID=2692847 RepID=UPI0016862969|nr:toll/interleukin-1 receptor domain-containing protein [Oscillatoria sp. FACHB-1407]MBD2465806.1 toll/interleukin-1 receptor domain-containing protein [Oscillatoria sp. FACHB-1407]
MVSSLFISYCRREAPFVDSFLKALEKRGFKVWLDYHVLVPGRPWEEQIYEGLKEAEVFLLVVSQESIASKNVKWEWEHAIALNKRIILIIFEAVKLPPELEQYEWIDLRGRFREGIKDLTRQLESPVPPKSAPPQSGFKVPLMVGLAIGVSAIVSLLSLLTIWTIYIPYYLFPLPYRIIKRDFNFFHVRNALLILPFFLVWTAVFLDPTVYSTAIFADITNKLFVIITLVAFVLLLLLYSPYMQRWGKPIASRPIFANPYNPKIQHPRQTIFTVDFAGQDIGYAETIIHCLIQYGHLYVGKNTVEAEQAEAVLVLISEFNGTTTFNPEEYVVYPILLQDTKAVNPDLGRIQWIDFRRGLKNLDKLAQLLPEPTRLLKALGIPPASNQTVLPWSIQILLAYFTVIASLAVGIWSIILLYILKSFSLGYLILVIPLVVVTLKIIFSITQSLITRKGLFISKFKLCLGFISLGVILFIPMFTPLINLALQEIRLVFAYSLLTMIYTFGIYLFLFASSSKATRRWFPS